MQDAAYIFNSDCQLVSEVKLSPSEKYVVGRSSNCNLYIQDHKLSKEQCALYSENQKWVLADLNSTNGTWQDLGAETEVTDKKIVKYNHTLMQFEFN